MVLLVTPPSWRPDLTDPADLAEEVIRLEGYGNVPVRQPRATAGRGPDRAAAVAAGDRPHARPPTASSRCTATRSPRRARRTASCWRRKTRAARGQGRQPAQRGPAAAAHDAAARPVPHPGAERRPRLRRHSALFETGQVFLPRPGSPGIAPILATDRGPTEAELATLAAALPDQPLRVAGVLAGSRELAGWWGPGRAGDVGGRDRGGALGGRGEPPRPSRCGRRPRRPGTRAAAPRCTCAAPAAASGWPGTRASCTRG